jgi:CheY-like chemotaxis protein
MEPDKTTIRQPSLGTGDWVPETVNLLFSVSDEGVGIPRERLQVIFEGFTQADSSTTRKYGGSGLGLTISKKLVNLMGGDIWVQSEEGKGSAFSFALTFKVEAEEKDIPAESSLDLRTLKVLVIDDEAANRIIMRQMLKLEGADVVEADSGKKAIEEFRQALEIKKPFNLVLLDSNLKDMTGFETAEILNREWGAAGMATIMISSDRRLGDLARSKELGIKAYLEKPVNRIELKRAVEAAMRRADHFTESPTSPVVEHGLRILLVEDSEDNRLLIQAFLKKMPYHLDICENGLMAVERFKSNLYDLVLMDVEMPVMDGYTATREIRKWEAEGNLQPTPIIALTAYAFEQDRQKSLHAGCNEHLTKPINKPRLLSTIETWTKKAGKGQST